MDSEKLARFITNLGQFNGYGSSVAQTKNAIETNSLECLRDDNDDRVIFEDSLKAIRGVASHYFSVESIIYINAQFTGDSLEQPKFPGKLRDAKEYPGIDDIRVHLWQGDDGSIVTYYPPQQIDDLMVQDIVDSWYFSEQTPLAAWFMFAKLAKLQPFEDGNKRTALIAVNHAMGCLKTQEYLMPPTGRIFIRFMDALLAYYGVGLEQGATSEKEGLKDFLSMAVDDFSDEQFEKLLFLDELSKKLLSKHLPLLQIMKEWSSEKLSSFLLLNENEQDRIIEEILIGNIPNEFKN